MPEQFSKLPKRTEYYKVVDQVPVDADQEQVIADLFASLQALLETGWGSMRVMIISGRVKQIDVEFSKREGSA